ncbi:hypothetical protein BN8_02192 [Fibrisoma limi BUZ 3]|uniref:Uncharacterized protein n=1 Tax=Fibrisoma limi BUZ 3 TaxID=1185876 RepID=I2GGU8_9BACT|nr:hypothetical protein BN8_02192 [Fibrisoma limi BUZ 3]
MLGSYLSFLYCFIGAFPLSPESWQWKQLHWLFT